MGFESLSDDLLLEILELIAEEATTPYYAYQGERPLNSLLSIVQCSRRLYGLGESILYRKVVQTTSQTLPRLIKTFLAHPNLADHVRGANLTDCGRDDPEPISQVNVSETLFNKEELQIIKAKIASILDCPDRDIWLKGIREGYWDAISAFLICLLPNLQALNVEQCQEERWQNELNRNLFSYTSPEKLRGLSISYSMRSQTCDKGLQAIPLRILASSNLQSFSGDMIRETSWPLPYASTNFSLKSLRLDRSNLSPNAIGTLIKSCPHLEVLKYEHDEEHNWSRRFDENPMHPTLIDTALLPLKSTLKELILYRTAQDAPPSPTSAEFGILKSLPSFLKLTKLSITVSLLLGPQMIENSTWYSSSLQPFAPSQSLDSCLPTCLENLKLKNCGENIYDQVKGLIEVKQIRVPRLKSLVIEFVQIRRRNWDYSPRNFPTVERTAQARDLDEMCVQKGVGFDVWYN